MFSHYSPCINTSSVLRKSLSQNMEKKTRHSTTTSATPLDTAAFHLGKEEIRQVRRLERSTEITSLHMHKVNQLITTTFRLCHLLQLRLLASGSMLPTTQVSFAMSVEILKKSGA
ncbi:hypothetical protein MUK42_25148 [Musa troglodytarum]|uniref:Uncharacterized protein n=1 Tax=Musa troglodytarum TaxID=320322 RepID=A0A9E7LCL2_9LILI|nr:hypothetical protein MUK42_25148 [Musa troglodytarum]